MAGAEVDVDVEEEEYEVKDEELVDFEGSDYGFESADELEEEEAENNNNNGGAEDERVVSAGREKEEEEFSLSLWYISTPECVSSAQCNNDAQMFRSEHG